MVLHDHRRLLREAFAKFAGHEIGTQGVAFFVALTRPRDAIGAAGEGQRSLAGHPWPDDRELRVRMGIYGIHGRAAHAH